MINTRKSTNEVDAPNSKTTEENIISRNVDVKTIFVGPFTIGREATVLELVPIKRIFRSSVK